MTGKIDPNDLAAAIAWLGLIILVNAYWIVWDFVIHRRTGWDMMTTVFREGLNSTLGCFIAGGIAFTVFTFITHMWNIRAASK